jgi:hypothetical protein
MAATDRRASIRPTAPVHREVFLACDVVIEVGYMSLQKLRDCTKLDDEVAMNAGASR